MRDKRDFENGMTKIDRLAAITVLFLVVVVIAVYLLLIIGGR